MLRIYAHEGGAAVDDALEEIRLLLEKHGSTSDLLILSELFLSGYQQLGSPMLVFQGAGDERFQMLAVWSRQYDCAIIVGAAVAGAADDVAEKPYNCSLAFVNGELAALHRKRVLWGDWEHASFSEGRQAPVVFRVKGVEVAMLICFEVEFPEFVREAAMLGAQLLAVPTAICSSAFPSWVIPAAAYANHICVVYVNNPQQGARGMSLAALPDGSTIDLPSFEYEPDAPQWQAERERNPYIEIVRRLKK